VRRCKPKRWVVGEERVLAQPVQEAPHQGGEDGGELLGLVQLACSIMVYRRIILG
jgi:hypothetical protein